MTLSQELRESGILYKEVSVTLLLRPQANAEPIPFTVNALQADVFGAGDVLLYTCPVTGKEEFAPMPK